MSEERSRDLFITAQQVRFIKSMTENECDLLYKCLEAVKEDCRYGYSTSVPITLMDKLFIEEATIGLRALGYNVMRIEDDRVDTLKIGWF